MLIFSLFFAAKSLRHALPGVRRIFEEAFGLRQAVGGGFGAVLMNGVKRGLATYTFVWDLGDIGVALMTVFNIIIILPMSGKAIKCLEEYAAMRKKEKAEKAK